MKITFSFIINKHMKILQFKQYITEDADLDTKLKKLGLKRGGMGYSIGKSIGGNVYAHRAYENQFPDVPLQNAKNALPKDFKYDVVKFNPKTGTFSFIVSNDFDSTPEPSVNSYITVKPDGAINQGKDAGWIWHHKWMWVADDYKGFDVEASKERSLKWASLDNVDKTRIGQRKHWDTHVVPRLSEMIAESDFQKFKGTYNWYNEIILKDAYTSAKDKQAAHRNFCAQIAKKAGKTVPSVISYYINNSNRYTIKEG